MSKEIELVDKEIKQVLNKNKRELATALIKPIMDYIYSLVNLVQVKHSMFLNIYY